MAPTNSKTKHKPEITKVGEEVLDLVIPYLHDIDDRNSVSLVSRKSYEIDGITRKRLTVHTLYYPNPASLNKRFPFIEALTLKGPPSNFNVTDDYDIQITPWIEQLALEFRCLKELHIRGLVVCDEDLETLAKTRGKDLRSLKISKFEGFSTAGLRHVSKYCNQLRTLCVGRSNDIDLNDGLWLHELALNSTVLERLHVMCTDVSYAEDLTLLATNCCNSLVSLKIGACYLNKLGDAFRYAVRLEHFAGIKWDEENELAGFQFPPNTRSLSINDFSVTQYSIILPFLNHIRKLKLAFLDLCCECQCMLYERCPNLEVLHTEDVCGDKGLKVIGKFCKKLRKLFHNGLVTHVGLIALAKGCTKLECLKVRLRDILFVNCKTLTRLA
ncbi:leucine-rich repeat, cysteine-containing subtype protein [Tanacetum coccineum]